ncbi:MAG: hypothetical protein NZ729_06335 [Methylococcales bacterium]|nr:hypothetical protein [Methylococcales bacterium]MEE2766349.1 hypothetical protein [Pseudomonadota bacterium]
MRYFHGLIRRAGRNTSRNRDSVIGQQTLGLEFMKVQDTTSLNIAVRTDAVNTAT